MSAMPKGDPQKLKIKLLAYVDCFSWFSLLFIRIQLIFMRQHYSRRFVRERLQLWYKFLISF